MFGFRRPSGFSTLIWVPLIMVPDRKFQSLSQNFRRLSEVPIPKGSYKIRITSTLLGGGVHIRGRSFFSSLYNTKVRSSPAHSRKNLLFTPLPKR
jgi:hypothetical protein